MRLKARIVYLIAILCYVCGVDALFYRLNRRAKRIVTFHNVLSDSLFRPGLANGVSNSLSDFSKIISECERRYPISNDLFDAKTLTITFDDGYRNQYTTAFRFLRERHIPAILFMAGELAPDGDMGKRGAPLLVDRLLLWVSEAPIAFIPGGDRLSYWSKTVWPSFARAVRAKSDDIFTLLDSQCSFESILAQLPDEYLNERLGVITASELNEMREAGWLIGWHTWSHRPLAALDLDDVYKELRCRPAYQNICLSYPFGNPNEIGEEAVRIAAELGYPCAVSNTNTDGRNATSRYFLPRLSLRPNKYELHFELSGAKYFIKNRRLLPRSCGR